MYSILKLPVAFSSQNIMTFDISCILGLQDSTNYGPGYLSDLTSYYSSRHASHTDLLAISQTCQASTLPPQDLHICFSPLEHCFRYRHGFHPYFLEVCAQMSSLQRSLSWSPVLSHHHSIHFTLLFCFFRALHHHLTHLFLFVCLLTLEWKLQESKDFLVCTVVSQALRTVPVTQ